MKKLLYLFLPCLLVLAACGGKNEPTDTKKKSIMATLDSVDVRGIQRMQVSETTTKIQVKGKEVISYVHRAPDEALPKVSNEGGDVFLDNKIVLRLTKGNASLFNRTFTKKDFASLLDPKFLAYSILEGIVYDKVTSQGIVYAASVCYPQSDLYVPFSIVISLDGKKMNISKVDVLDEELPKEEDKTASKK